MRTITIQLASHTYEILIAGGLLERLGVACRQVELAGMPVVVTNPTVAALYGAAATASLQQAGYRPLLIEIPDGEEFKNAATLQSVYDRLIETGADRHSFVVALGGGVVGDLAGFAAATFLRGIPFVQVPTTLLAQVDSSVGGKTGIDHPLGKNLIGAFYQPQLVLSDVSTLMTLTDRHYRAGLAEVVKYGAVLDAEFFALLEQKVDGLLQRDVDLLGAVVARCCELKAQVVEQDEREAGLRAVLNYGHTVGHALETLCSYRELVHGEAVAIGMVAAARLSCQAGYCTAAEQQRITVLLQRLGLPTELPVVGCDALTTALGRDKKNRSGTVQYVCNKGIGAYRFHRITPAELAEACCSGR